MDHCKEINIKAYQHIIKKLIYLLCGTRPNIAFVVSQLSRHNANPRIGYFKNTKQIIRYLKGIMHLSIVYRAGINKKNQSLYSLVSYTNSNYANDPNDRKSMIRHCCFINGRVVSWWNKKQQTVSTSITKAKYIALKYTIQKNIWIRWFFNKLSLVESIHACIFRGNNEISIILIKNTESQVCIKHINVQYHYICKLVVDKKIEIK